VQANFDGDRRALDAPRAATSGGPRRRESSHSAGLWRQWNSRGIARSVFCSVIIKSTGGPCGSKGESCETTAVDGR